MQAPTPTSTDTTVTDDPQARAVLQRAFESTARWQSDFQAIFPPI